MYRSIEDHISDNLAKLEDPSMSPQARRHLTEELEHLMMYHENHPEDHHDPTDFEMFCDEEPWAPECKLHDN
jgi:hypothetical protein|tara:strand:- start:1927 stop:2142 length:216 start_codon:yes stop_codon:yes gene_type:complete